MSTSTQMKDYRMEETYEVSDSIFHKGFNDHGVVVEIGKTTDNAMKCVVDFEKVGRKRLIMGLKN